MAQRFFAAVGILVIITCLGIFVVRSVSGYITAASNAVSTELKGEAR